MLPRTHWNHLPPMPSAVPCVVKSGPLQREMAPALSPLVGTSAQCLSVARSQLGLATAWGYGKLSWGGANGVGELLPRGMPFPEWPGAQGSLKWAIVSCICLDFRLELHAFLPWQGQKRPPQGETHLPPLAPSRKAGGQVHQHSHHLDCGIWQLCPQLQLLQPVPTSPRFPSCLIPQLLCESFLPPAPASI
jgi:hypothetical protein